MTILNAEQISERANQLLNDASFMGIIYRGEVKNKTQSKNYTPKDEAFEKYQGVDNKNYKVISYISPLARLNYCDVEEKGEYLIKAVRQSLNLKKDQVERMNEQTKSRIIESSMIGWEKGLEEVKSSWIDGENGEFFREEYEKQKLKFIVEQDKQPKIIEDELYLFIKTRFLIMLKKVYEGFLATKHSAIKYPLSLIKTDGVRYLMDFWIEVAKNTTKVSFEVVDKIYTFYNEKLSTGLTAKEIENYKELSMCVFTRRLPNIYQKNLYPQSSNIMYSLQNAVTYATELKKILTKENFRLMVLNVIVIGEIFKQTIEEGKNLESISSDWMIKIGMDILEYLPALCSELD